MPRFLLYMCYLARQLSTHSLSAANLYPVACSAYMEMSPLRFPFARLNNIRDLSVGGKEEGFSFLAPLSLLSVRTATGPSCSQQPPVFPETTLGSFITPAMQLPINGFPWHGGESISSTCQKAHLQQLHCLPFHASWRHLQPVISYFSATQAERGHLPWKLISVLGEWRFSQLQLLPYFEESPLLLIGQSVHVIIICGS